MEQQIDVSLSLSVSVKSIHEKNKCYAPKIRTPKNFFLILSDLKVENSTQSSKELQYSLSTIGKSYQLKSKQETTED